MNLTFKLQYSHTQLTAKFSKKSYTLTLSVNEGEGTFPNGTTKTTISVEYNDKLSLHLVNQQEPVIN